jgi:hypothetical protein
MHNDQNQLKKKKSVLGFLHFDKPSSEQVNVLNAIENFVNKIIVKILWYFVAVQEPGKAAL